MGKKLVLAEKPSVAKDLAAILGANEKNKHYYEGKDYIVTWTLGHLLTLKMPEDLKKEWKTWNLEDLPMIPKKWEIKPLPKTMPQLKAIQQLSKRKDLTGGVIATDSGREGELVAREVFQWVGFNKPLERLWISSQTKKAVLEGFKQLKPAKVYDALYESALARSKADWLVGLNITRGLTTKYQDNLSAGRVQTPTLAMVKKAQDKVETFLPENYYVVELLYQKEKGRLQLKNPHSLKTTEEAQKKIASYDGQLGKVTQIQKKESKIPVPLPYDLTEIQRVANQKYQFSAKKTLSLVQSLYETHKMVSYPRTDSKYLPSDLRQTMKERLESLAGAFPEVKEFIKNGAKVEQQAVFNDSKVTDHYGLIPTEERPRFDKLSSDESKIYHLIVERFLGLFQEPKITEKVKVTVTFNNDEYVFNQEKIIQAGFSKEQEEKAWVDFKEGMSIKGNFAISKELTTAPNLLTEATLLGNMDKYSLGTPATRADIIEKLLKTELMERNGNRLKVTPKGKQLLSLVNPSLISPDLTAQWEQHLEDIAKKKLNPQQFIQEIEKDTRQLIKEIKDSKETYKDFSMTTKICPECGSNLKERNTKDGKIYICSNPECSYKRRKDPKISNHRCNQCHRKMEILEGKNGAFFKCKYCGISEKIPDKKQKNKKMTKHEEKKLLKKVNQETEPMESPLAQALKAAMKK